MKRQDLDQRSVGTSLVIQIYMMRYLTQLSYGANPSDLTVVTSSSEESLEGIHLVLMGLTIMYSWIFLMMNHLISGLTITIYGLN